MKKFLLACVIISLVSSFAFAGEFIEGDVIVVFKSGESVTRSGLSETGTLRASVNAAVNSLGASIKTSYNDLSEADNKIFLHIHSDTKTTEQLISDLLKRDDVLAASPNYINYPRANRPNDEFYSYLWGLEKMNAPAVWDTTTGSENIYVAVMDSGIYEHSDLIANLATEYAQNFGNTDSWTDQNGHGTHVAGTIGAVGNNNIGIAGVNWKVKIIPLKIENANGGMPNSAIISALNYLTGLLRDNPNMNLAAVNCSFGNYASMTPTEALTQDAAYTAYKAFDNLNRSLLIFAGGNESIKEGGQITFTEPGIIWQVLYGSNEPAFNKGDYDYPISYTGLNNVISVGSIDSSDKAPLFTCFGDNIHVAAPGSQILSTYNSQDIYREMQGNSMAAPHVTGSAALLLSAYPDATPNQVKQAIFQSANSNINPLVYPYQLMCEYAARIYEIRIVNVSIDQGALTPEEGQIAIEQFTQFVMQELKDYEQYDGNFKVSKYGFIDLSAALEKLSQFVANGEYLTPEGDSGGDDSIIPLKNSSSGCNTGFTSGIIIFAAISLFLISRKYIL
ncbi:MAG: S8 family serine peptidase [Synergistaceae bacterium]|nr:S8 family serine peptidase [Synergistaceae bacterium]